MLTAVWALVWWLNGTPWLTTPVHGDQVIWNWSAWLVSLVCVAIVDVVFRK